MKDAMREALARQAWVCESLSAPLSATLLRLLLDEPSLAAAAARLSPDAYQGSRREFMARSYPLRLLAFFHYLELIGHALLRERRWNIEALCAAVTHNDLLLGDYLSLPPQTNDVRRSSALLLGLHAIAQASGLPLQLFEIGASAGLNLNCDHYEHSFQTEGTVFGEVHSPVRLQCKWVGPHPRLAAPLTIKHRCGCDLHPLLGAQGGEKARALSYIWIDHRYRLQQTAAALDRWRVWPVQLERAEASIWLQRVCWPQEGTATVILQSVVWQYLTREGRSRLVRTLQVCGNRATPQQPLYLLRLEPSNDEALQLSLATWPGGEDKVLALVSSNGTSIQWMHDDT